MKPAAASGATPAPRATSRSCIAAHVVPFAAWILLLLLLPRLFPPGAWQYALRTALGVGLVVALRPWRWYPAPALQNLPLAILVGGGVFVIWVVPEIGLGAEPYPLLQELYLRFAVLPLGEVPKAALPSLYDPAVCGWGLSLTRLAGSAFVIAVIEEFFWRGFLYRWLIDRDFLRPKLGEFEWEAFLTMCLLFGLEHDRWLAGILAGAAYGWLMIRTRDIWAAATAHVITNLLLGIYVLYFGGQAYSFW